MKIEDKLEIIHTLTNIEGMIDTNEIRSKIPNWLIDRVESAIEILKKDIVKDIK